MAVYEHAYKPYEGALTPRQSRFLVLPRFALREIFRTKLFLAFFVSCFVWPLFLAVLIYLPHNLSFLELIGAQVGSNVFKIDFNGRFFLTMFMMPQGFFGFFMAFLVGPALIAGDLNNNALPLYLSRPFTRWDYILGKSVILLGLLSLVSWVPGLFLFLLQAYLEGGGWLGDNLRIGAGIFIGSWVYMLLLCLVSLALSAYVRWKPVARLLLFLLFVVAKGTSHIVNELYDTEWGSVVSLFDMIAVVWAGLLGSAFWVTLPPWAAWASVVITCTACLLLLLRKIRAYEVVR